MKNSMKCQKNRRKFLKINWELEEIARSSKMEIWARCGSSRDNAGVSVWPKFSFKLAKVN